MLLWFQKSDLGVLQLVGIDFIISLLKKADIHFMSVLNIDLFISDTSAVAQHLSFII